VQEVARETRQRIWRAFRELSDRQREVFVLRHLEGWSTEGVASALGIRAGSVKRHLFRAIRHLRAAAIRGSA
jgi:RNA polymerase sigma-70 factor (ECF subfamily)